MCGISGIFSFERSEISLLDIVVEMNRSIRHRGPDDEGFVLFDSSNHYIAGSSDTEPNAWHTSFPYKPQHYFQEYSSISPYAVLGHRRLSIIDLSPAGHQPMCDTVGRYWLVFNGAIYNFEELKSELVSLGHSFYSHTDTEVLLHAYIAWGKDCVHKFIGMWAFVIYDKIEKKVFASRDPIGVKPFYYTLNANYFAFASEIKALRTLPFIKEELNDQAIFDFLVLSKCELEEEGIFKNIFELQPGTNLEILLDSKNLTKSVYIKTQFLDHWERFDEIKNDQNVSSLRELLQDSIKLHLRTDAKIGVCLSGGLDSSLISALVSKEIQDLPVFTIVSKGYPEDEAKWAKVMVDKLNLKWHTTNPQSSDLIKNFETFLHHQDIPCLGANTYAHYELMRSINQQGIKVTIDGQGADELFAGYDRYYSAFISEAFNNRAWSSIIKSFKQPDNNYIHKKKALMFPFEVISSRIIGAKMTSRIYKRKHAEFAFINKDFWHAFEERTSMLQDKVRSSLNRSLFYDYHGSSLKTMLRVADRNSMSFGIETRVPFSDDIRLEKFAFKVPSSYKIKDNYSKSLLREAARSWVPDEICYRKDKKGFSIPQKKWLLEIGEELFPYFDSVCSSYINKDLLQKEWMDMLKVSSDTSRFFRLLCFAVWLKTIKK
jgi:asparagine synthase (glutamine-hydrolysing)